jgi:hypothetical protein
MFERTSIDIGVGHVVAADRQDMIFPVGSLDIAAAELLSSLPNKELSLSRIQIKEDPLANPCRAQICSTLRSSRI